ncbi:MAG: hypothetical protein JW727_03185 [Candidatus Aenigmarchaeota archaeon]|nr:hypothetical protein [Candidatus Aenigmarchaeota archaeon]
MVEDFYLGKKKQHRGPFNPDLDPDRNKLDPKYKGPLHLPETHQLGPPELEVDKPLLPHNKDMRLPHKRRY